MKIITNRAKCRACHDVIESVNYWNYEICSCGAIAIWGGNKFLGHRGAEKDFEDLAIYLEEVR